jgi:hypothetical protein
MRESFKGEHHCRDAFCGRLIYISLCLGRNERSRIGQDAEESDRDEGCYCCGRAVDRPGGGRRTACGTWHDGEWRWREAVSPSPTAAPSLVNKSGLGSHCMRQAVIALRSRSS